MILSLLLAACGGSGSGAVLDGTLPDTGAPPDDPTPPSPPSTTPATPPTLSGVSSRLHPEFGTVVIVSWTQDVAASVRVTFTVDGVPRDTPVRALAAGAHEEVLLGLPYGAETTFRVVAENAGGEVSSPDAAATTGPLPASLPLPVSVLDAGSDPASPYVLLSINPIGGNFGSQWWTVVVDRAGRPVWARPAALRRMTMHPRPNWDGDALLVDQNSYWATFDGGLSSVIEELDLQGNVTHTFEAPGLHHPFTPLPDGGIAYGAMALNRYADEQLIVVGRDGSTRSLFDCADWLASIGEFDEYCGSNTLNYDPVTDTFVFSFYSFDTVVWVDGQGGARAWFGHVAGTWDFDPPQSAFWWQHGAQLRASDGAFATSTYDAQSPRELVVRVYEIDEASRTLRQIEVYGAGEGVYGDQMGEVSFLPSGHVLHNFGTLPRIREYAPDGAVVWDVEWPNPGHDVGRTTPIPDLYALAGPRP